MNRTKIIAIIFLVVALVQIGLPASRILSYEQTLKNGKAFKFRTAPVDPYDAFRGRYVALRFETETATRNEKEEIGQNRKVFVLVETGPDGFARFTSASLNRPASGDYLEVKSMGISEKNELHVEVPFDRFYMEESLAPDAEHIYREHSGNRSERDAFAIVRIHKGRGVIEQVFIGTLTLAEAVRGILTQPR